MPNWNSIVMPVATPSTKLMPNSVPQNLVMRFQTSLPVITYAPSMITRIIERPRVSGTNRKWYMAVRANCQRDRSATRRSGISQLRYEAAPCCVFQELLK